MNYLHYFSIQPLLSGPINYLFALFQHTTITVWTYGLLVALFQHTTITVWTYGLFVYIISAYNHHCLDLWIICLHYFRILPLLSGPMDYLFALFQHGAITVWTYEVFGCIISHYYHYYMYLDMYLDIWIFCLHDFSMLPLLVKDGQVMSYLSTMVLYSILYCNFYPSTTPSVPENRSETPRWGYIITNLLVSLFSLFLKIFIFRSISFAMVYARLHRHITASDPGVKFESKLCHITFIEIDREIISTVILPLLLIQKGQSSITPHHHHHWSFD